MLGGRARGVGGGEGGHRTVSLLVFLLCAPRRASRSAFDDADDDAAAVFLSSGGMTSICTILHFFWSVANNDRINSRGGSSSGSTCSLVSQVWWPTPRTRCGQIDAKQILKKYKLPGILRIYMNGVHDIVNHCCCVDRARGNAWTLHTRATGLREITRHPTNTGHEKEISQALRLLIMFVYLSHTHALWSGRLRVVSCPLSFLVHRTSPARNA